MIYYFLHDQQGMITSVQSRTLPVVEGMEVYDALKIEAPQEDYLRSKSEFCYVDVDSGALVFPDPKPSDDHTFDYGTKQWSVLLSDQKQTKWSEIKASRDTEEFSTFVWNNHTFDCDEVSQRRIQGAVQLALIDDSLSIVWTLADNTTQTFAASELKQIGQALSNHVKDCHDRGRMLRVQIDAATTEEDLEAIVW